MENYKTVKQIADEIGVVRQTIHKYIQTEPLKPLLNDYIKHLGKGNKVYIHIDGVELIRKHLTGGNEDEKDTFKDNINDSNNNVDEEDETSENIINEKDEKDNANNKKDNIEVNKYSKKYIEMLENQIQEKDKIIAELSKSIFNFSQSVNADKHNELVENIKPSLIEAASSESRTHQQEKEKSGGFFRNLFKSKKKKIISRQKLSTALPTNYLPHFNEKADIIYIINDVVILLYYSFINSSSLFVKWKKFKQINESMRYNNVKE